MNDFSESIKAILKNGLCKIIHRLTQNYCSYILIIVIFLAFILRYLQINIGLPYLYFWDEPQISSTALRIMKTGDYNPHFFNYGSLMIYLNLLVDKLHFLYLSNLSHRGTGYLEHIENIRISADTGWHWTISHPSFYYWNRFLTVVIGTGTVFVTYLIGRHIFNKWIGITAAFFLASLPIHIAHSGYVTPDVPVAFFTSLIVLFSVLFIEHKKIFYFVLSLICVGLVSAIKYNAGLAIIIPVVSLFWMTKKKEMNFRKSLVLIIALIPAITFFLIMPYAILDFPNFINHVLDEIEHYKIIGHPKSTSVPGWDHFSFQMHNFYENIGLSGTFMVLLGLVGIFFRPLFFLTLLLPIVFILFMSTMKVNFHRNFIQVYPFIAIIVGAAFYYLYKAFHFLGIWFKRKDRMMPIVCTVMLALFVLLPQAYAAYREGIKKYHIRDTRSTVIDMINNMNHVKKICIAKELKIHEQDINRLKYDYAVQSIEIMSSKKPVAGTIYVLPSLISQVDNYYQEEVNIKQSIIDRINQEDILQHLDHNYIEGKPTTMLDIFSTSPSLLITKRMPYEPLCPNVIAFDTCERSETGTWFNDINNELTIGEGAMATPVYSLEHGEYRFTFEAKKPAQRQRSMVFGFGGYEANITVKHMREFEENISIKVSIFGDHILLTEKIFDPIEDFTKMEISFHLIKDQNVSVRIENINYGLNHDLPVQTIIKQLKILTGDAL